MPREGGQMLWVVSHRLQPFLLDVKGIEKTQEEVMNYRMVEGVDSAGVNTAENIHSGLLKCTFSL